MTRRGFAVTAGAIVAMLGGITLTSIFIGYVSSALTRAQWIALQGLRRIRARDHVVVCGGGNIGSTVIDLLTSLGKRIVVVESQPHPSLVRRAREPDVDLLTGDATRDDTLDCCDIPNASAVLALTNRDTANLEIALGARARSASVPLVVRMESDTFARATARLFGISTFSPAALVAAEFAGLSRFTGTRARIVYAGQAFTVGELAASEIPHDAAADGWTALCVWRDERLVLIRDFADIKSSDVLLFVFPLAGFRSQTRMPERGTPRTEEVIRESPVGIIGE